MRKAIDVAPETEFDEGHEFIFEARRSGDWWALSVPEFPGVHSQVRRLEQAEAMIKEAIGLAFEVSPSEVNVHGPVIVVNPELDELLLRTRTYREYLVELRAEVDALSRRLARDMAEEGIPVRDIAKALDVSFQHAAKLAKAEKVEERVAREIMTEALGVVVENHDDGSRDAMFDFQFTMPNGRRGAAEMTSITDYAAREWESLAKEGLHVQSAWAWTVRPRQLHPNAKDLTRFLPRILKRTENSGETDVSRLRLTDLETKDPAFQWLQKAELDIDAVKGSSHPGKVYLEPATAGSFIGHSLDPMLDWLERKLREPRFDSKFKKLSDSKCAERHLVLRLDVGAAVPDEHWFALADAALPSRAPAVVGCDLTGLWLIPNWGRSIVFWTSERGWQRHETANRDRKIAVGV